MIYVTLKTVHLLSSIVWIGGMVSAHFFRAVLVASLLTLASGVWMLCRVAKQFVQLGGSFEMPLAWGPWCCS